MKQVYLIICLTLSTINVVLSQNISKDPTFKTFDGTVYSMPKMLLKINGHLTKTILQQYANKVYDYDSLTTISLTSIDIPETIITKGEFPGVPQSTKFCMILYSEMTIREAGIYEFILNSDDGSTLWIDDVVAVNNDGGHPMKFKRETIPLQAGTYPIKLWYFQGHPDRFGFQFDALYKGPIPTSSPMEINLSAELLFNFNESILTTKAQSVIEQTMSEIDLTIINSIDIIGHTDNIGSTDRNMKLSLLRAESVTKHIRKLITGKEIQINVIGMGETDPVSSNESEIGRAENRRVQIRYF